MTVCSGVHAPRAVTDVRLTSVLREHILAPQSLAEVRRLAAEALEHKLRGAGSAAKERQARITALERELSNLVDAIATCGVSPTLQAKLVAAEAEMAEINKAPVPTLVTRTVDDVNRRSSSRSTVQSWQQLC